jgi:hypothetical protein
VTRGNHASTLNRKAIVGLALLDSPLVEKLAGARWLASLSSLSLMPRPVAVAGPIEATVGPVEFCRLKSQQSEEDDALQRDSR